MSSSSRSTIGTRSKSRDDELEDSAAAAAVAKENVDNEKAAAVFQPPQSSSTNTTPRKPKTPSRGASTGTEKTSRTAASLFSPSPYASGRLYADSRMMKKPDPFPDNWEEAMGGSSSSLAGSNARNSGRRECQQQQDSFGYAQVR